MGIFENLGRLFKSNINDLIAKAENPEKILNQVLLEMNEQLVEAKKAVAVALADEKKLERSMNENMAQAKEWESKAILALKSNREDLAKEALLKKQAFEKDALSYKQQYDVQHENVEKLKGMLRQLQDKIEEAERKKNLLIARQKRAEAQQQIAKTMGKLGNSSAFAAFERMEKKVDQIEAMASAQAELENLNTSSSLEDEFKKLESGSANADLLLEELKQKMSQG
jgi:phage shock protein A